MINGSSWPLIKWLNNLDEICSQSNIGEQKDNHQWHDIAKFVENKTCLQCLIRSQRFSSDVSILLCWYQITTDFYFHHFPELYKGYNEVLRNIDANYKIDGLSRFWE